MPARRFQTRILAAHLQMNFRVIDEQDRQLAMGRSLAQLRSELGGAARTTFSEPLAWTIRLPKERTIVLPTGISANCRRCLSFGARGRSWLAIQHWSIT